MCIIVVHARSQYTEVRITVTCFVCFLCSALMCENQRKSGEGTIGLLNIITKIDFEGLHLSVHYEICFILLNMWRIWHETKWCNLFLFTQRRTLENSLKRQYKAAICASQVLFVQFNWIINTKKYEHKTSFTTLFQSIQSQVLFNSTINKTLFTTLLQ